MKPIDIVVTYVDNTEPGWVKSFNKYKKEELEKGIISKTNKQAFADERFRDWDTLKYWFRGVEKNCPWVNKVFLLVYDEKQVPNWINDSNEKLKIVYHKDFIPETFLPVFNSRTIELFTCRIKELSNNYIRCNDDCYFLNPIPAEMFFINGKPKMPNNEREAEPFNIDPKTAAFWQALNNNLELEQEIYHSNHTYGFYHLQSACSKNFELEILNNNYDKIYKRQSYSRFKNENQFTIYLYDNLTRLSGNAILDNDMYKHSCYKSLSLNLDYNEIKTNLCVCINDTDHADKDYIKIKKQLIDFFEELFPNKSSFEK